MAHTPTPWTLTDLSGSGVLIGEFEIRGMFGDKPNVYPIFQKSRNAIHGASIYLHPDDAQYIVRAVNAFEPMWKALKSSAATAHYHNTNFCGGSFEDCTNPACVRAKAALALADKDGE